MKKLLITSLAMTAMSFSLFAEELDTEWFNASFTNTTESGECSVGGEWDLKTQDPETGFTTNESGVAILKLVDVESTNTVDFVADDKQSPDADLPIAINSMIVFEGCEELPAIPAGIKTALIGMIDGNYWSVGYDAEGETNKWFNSGVPAEFKKELEVRVKGIYQGETNIVEYSVGKETWTVPVVDAEFQTVSFSGNGSVSLLEGKTTAPAAEGVYVHFYTNGVEVVVKGEEVSLPWYQEDLPWIINGSMEEIGDDYDDLKNLGIASITNELGAGWSWVVDPHLAEVTCETNFYYVQAAPVTPTQKFLDDIAAAKDGDTVKATGNITVSSPITVNKSITLDLDGNTLTSTSDNDYAIVATAVVTITNGTITASYKGICANDAAGLKLYAVTLSAADRAVNLSNDGSSYIPGELYIDEATTITSSGECGVICGNGNSDNARTVTVDGTITSYMTALQISGNNTAVVNGDLTLTTYTGFAPALYFGGTWYDQKGTGTQPTLTFNGSATGKKVAIATDGGDLVGVQLTIGSDAEVTGETYGLVFQVPGSLTVNGGTYNGTTPAYVAKTDNQTVEIAAGEFSSTDGAAVVADDGAAAFISGGTFEGTELVDDTLLVEGKMFEVDDNVQTVVDVVAMIDDEPYSSLEAALKAAESDDTVKLYKDLVAGADEFDAIKADITIDCNGKVLSLDNVEVTLNNNLTIICSGETTEKGVCNNAQITIAEGKTLDLSALSWAAGVIGCDPTTAAFTLEAGAKYKQGLGNWNDSVTNIFSAVEDYAITLEKTATVATITTVKIPEPVIPEIQLSVTNAEYYAEIDFPTVIVEGYTEGTDYDKSWSPAAITEPAAGATNEYVVTVTMKGDYTGSNTAKFYVWKAVPAPTMWNVTFSTNTLAVSEYNTTVQDGQSLTVAQIPEFEGGKWDVDPSKAVITCNTNFNYTIETKVYPPEIPEEKKAAYDTWSSKYGNPDPTLASTKEAFLLDCDPANLATAKAAFKIVSITQDGENWIVKVTGDKGEGETYGNGFVNIVPYVITGASEDAEFFQAVLDWEYYDAE